MKRPRSTTTTSDASRRDGFPLDNTNNNNSLFVSDAGRMTTPSFLLLLAGPMLLSGNYRYAIMFVVLAIGLAIKSSMDNMPTQDKLHIQYNSMTWKDVVAELEQLEEEEENEKERDNNSNAQQRKQRYVLGLHALAKKYDRRHRLIQDKHEREELALVCQQLAYTTLRLYGGGDKRSRSSTITIATDKKNNNTSSTTYDNDKDATTTTANMDIEIVAGSISLLALLAKNVHVRKRYKYQSDVYSLRIPIQVLERVLEQAKTMDVNGDENDHNDVDNNVESKEEVLAETLRKGCLYLGAVCNDDTELGLAEQIVGHDGLSLILEIGNWFRFHEDVANWTLWAVFTLCYDRVRIKAQLVRLRGIPTICELMKNNPTNLEVNRHGIALLFDLLRENSQTATTTADNSSTVRPWDPWEVRKIALNSGLHDVVVSCMNEFSDSQDVMIMGQEILIGTGYRGQIPVYRQVM